MKDSKEVREELERLIRYRTQLEQSGTDHGPKIILLTMRIDALKWVLNEE